MRRKIITSCLAFTAVGLMLSACSEAAPQAQSDPAKANHVTSEQVDTSRLSAMGLQLESIKPAPVAGLFEVMTDQGLFYLGNNGALLISGRIFDISSDEPLNLTDLSLNTMRQQQLQDYTDSMLVYAAAKQKYVITVFTDPTCGYCKQLHKNMAQYHDAGITVRYLAYPRSGVTSPAGQTLANVWCADDPLNALSVAKNGGTVATARCANPVAEHYALGQKFGVTGTPAIILPSGELIPGLLPLPILLERLAE